MAIDFDMQDGVATITLNRPEKLNAMDPEHYRALSEAWMRVRDDNDIIVAIVTGAGPKSFTTGADIKGVFDGQWDLSTAWQTQEDQLLNRGLEIWKPVISAINGYCVGGGMTLMMATDIRIAASNATFALAEVKRGVIAANGGTQRILSQLPYAIAMEMLLTGDTIDAATAERWGLINRVVEPNQLMETAFDYARRIAGNAPLALQASKELALRGREIPLSMGLRAEQYVARILQASDDMKEGMAAFADRRPPRFSGK